MCATYAHDILAIYGLNIKYDSSETHPNKLCSSCYQRLINTTRMTIVLSLYQQHSLKICGSRIQQIAVYVCIPGTYLLVPEQSWLSNGWSGKTIFIKTSNAMLSNTWSYYIIYIHRRLNLLMSTHSGVQNSLKRLMAIMREHHTECSPALHNVH